MLRLKLERQKRGWTQTRLAALTGIASPDLSAIERRMRPAYPGWRRRLALVFGIAEDKLFAEVAEPDAAGAKHAA
jgi:transcriptional regulator with XRE-family HTH domain